MPRYGSQGEYAQYLHQIADGAINGEKTPFSSLQTRVTEENIRLAKALTPLCAIFFARVMKANEEGLYFPTLSDDASFTTVSYNRTFGSSPVVPGFLTKFTKEEAFPTVDQAIKVFFPTENNMIPPINIPIGDYGEPWARAIAKATYVVHELLVNDPKTTIRKDCEQARQNWPQEMQLLNARPDDPFSTFVEAVVQTLPATFAEITAKRVKEFENPILLLAAIMDSDQLNLWGSDFPFATIVPMARHGQIPAGELITPTEQGNTVEMSQELRTFLHDERLEYKRRALFTGGCPVRRKGLEFPQWGKMEGSGIDYMVAVFAMYTAIFYSQETLQKK